MAISLSRMERQALAGFAISVVVMAVLHEVAQLKELGVVIQTQLLEDHYKVLSLEDSATKQDIQTAFKRATSQLNSRPLDDEGRHRRVKLTAAFETLSNADARMAYDNRLKLVRFASTALTCVAVGAPVAGADARLAQSLGLRSGRSGRLDPKSFSGQVFAALGKMETQVSMTISKEPSEKLGVQLVSDRRGAV
eukprot:CAMPEP_0180769196 /NCGR_PEP_ID=MMETSP1038_2-20121128/40970_1 /TAXON_ID=632150 /ORGANISM="Azadinium spinosum, Strain 3D9" /LENGTH=193 /DNA_ID=CAMNT_0022803899 /DNA_START=24 /DNA_END=602 /DNA_ORIENTATION=-